MVEPGSWRLLAEGNQGDVIIAVDYDVTGRVEAGFTDLARLLKGADPQAFPQIWESVQPALGDDVGMTEADYVKRWADGARELGRPVGVILGFCAGAAFASALAEELGRTQPQTPRIILFDPESPNPVTLYYHFYRVVGSLASALPAEEVERAQEAGLAASRSGAPLEEIAARLLELFRETGTAAFTSSGLDASYAEELIATYRSFVAFLVAASKIDHKPGWATAVAFSSASETSGLNSLAPEVRAELVAEEYRTEAVHAELLRDADVVRILSGLLNQGL